MSAPGKSGTKLSPFAGICAARDGSCAWAPWMFSLKAFAATMLKVSLAEGFRRMVMLAGDRGQVYYIVGSANHIQLDEELKNRLRGSPAPASLEPHYLWYRRIEGVLELAGADSQSADSHERLKDYIESYKSALVKAMYKLH